MGWIPELELVAQPEGRRLRFPVERLLNGGYAGRDQDAVWRHVEELAEIGVPAPGRTPTLYAIGNNLVTTSDKIQVQHDRTSGEVEYVLLIGADDIYVTVGSDHTDRELERRSVEWSKQAYPDLLATEVWRYQDVADHWDEIVLRCWVSESGERRLYQEATLAALLPPKVWLGILGDLFGTVPHNVVLMSGTIPSMGGISFAESYQIEMYDPVLDRAIRHGYGVEVLRQKIV